MGVLTITRIPLKGGKKQEMVVPVYQGSGVKLEGDGSSHHYKDPSERGEEARDGCACISRIWGLNLWEMGVLTITRIPPKRGNKLDMVEPVHQGSGVKLLGDGSSRHYKDPFERGK